MFRAFDPESDRLVAVKVFTIDLPPEQVHQVVADFERLLGGSLTHRAIAAPLATGIHDNHPYLVLEYASADSLDIVVRHGPPAPGDGLRVAAQLAGALDFAAADGILHGALHPRDVLLTPEDTRLTGLGVAQAFERLEVPAPIRRPYTPPECIGSRAWDRRADVFSLAAVMHELLWGRRLSAMGEQAAEALTPLDGADLDALRTVFERALAEDPAARFETALEFAEGLKQAFPKVVPTRPTRRTPRAAALVEPRLPLDEPELEFEVRGGKAAGPDPLDMEAVDAELSRLVPTPVEVLMRPSDEGDRLPIRELAPEPEPARFDEVESEPEEAVRSAVPVGLLNVRPQPDVASAALDPTRSAVWPLALALTVGAAIGFGGGYFFAHFERTVAPVEEIAAEAPAPAGLEWTENTVAEAPEAPAAAPPATSKPAAASGRLLVRSTPAGARVFVDGREVGRTPLTVDDLARGERRVRVVRDGYATAERRITITAAGSSQSMTVPLTRASTPRTPAPAPPATGPGRMTVISRPAGARVFVDERLVGTTPMQIPEVAAGTHTVRLELEGYRRWASTVRIAAGNNRVTASLER